MRVPFANFSAMHQPLRSEFMVAFEKILDKEDYILGGEGEKFEAEFAQWNNAKYALGCGNGLDALYLSLKALQIQPGDEVIVPAHTFVATALSVSYLGATPVLVDVEEDTGLIDATKIEAAITSHTKCIIPVHLYGQMADMDPIHTIAKRYQLHVVEDAAQAHGARYWGKLPGANSEVACYSFYPGKNLGALGDAGAIVSNNSNFIEVFKALRNYGATQRYHHDLLGTNSRMDEIQAALLRCKIPHLKTWNAHRTQIAKKYLDNIHNPYVKLLVSRENREHVWHIFAIKSEHRDELQKHLSSLEIDTLVHYPVPIHLHKAYIGLGYKSGNFAVAERFAKTELSLPMFFGMTNEQVESVIAAVNSFCPK